MVYKRQIADRRNFYQLLSYIQLLHIDVASATFLMHDRADRAFQLYITSAIEGAGGGAAAVEADFHIARALQRNVGMLHLAKLHVDVTSAEQLHIGIQCLNTLELCIASTTQRNAEIVTHHRLLKVYVASSRHGDGQVVGVYSRQGLEVASS